MLLVHRDDVLRRLFNDDAAVWVERDLAGVTNEDWSGKYIPLNPGDVSATTTHTEELTCEGGTPTVGAGYLPEEGLLHACSRRYLVCLSLERLHYELVRQLLEGGVPTRQEVGQGLLGLPHGKRVAEWA